MSEQIDNDKTFLSELTGLINKPELIDLLNKYEIGYMSSTPAPIIAEFIVQVLGAFNFASVQKYKGKDSGDYIRVLESENYDLLSKLNKMLSGKE